MNNKKGISAVVATVLIILITVAAVTIIWAAIIPMIRNTIEGSQECFDASAAISVMSDYSCYNSSGICYTNESAGCGTEGNCIAAPCNGTWANRSAKVQVSREVGDFELVSLKLQAGYQGTTESYEVTTVPDQNEERLYVMPILDLSSAEEAGVVAVVKAGNRDEECTSSGLIPISACA